MNRRATVVALALAAGLWSGVGIGRAGQDANLARGFSPGQLYDYSGIDSVNLYNGVLGLRLPIGPRYPVGDQLSYGLTLSYSSNVWDPTMRIVDGEMRSLMQPRRSADAGLGWTISLGGHLYGPLHRSEAPLPSTGYQFESEDGSLHVFYALLHADEDPQACSFTRDNTYLRLCGSEDEPTIEFPDGTKRTYAPVPPPPAEVERPWDFDRYRLTRIEDRFENWVEVIYNDGQTVNSWTIHDSLGRSHTVSFQSVHVDTEDMWVVDFADLEGFEGGVFRYDFVHESVEIARSCKYFEGTESNRFVVPLLRTVLLPADESGFRMSYRMPDYNTECVDGLKDAPGTIERLDLPTGGRLEWTYANYLFSLPDQEDPDPAREIVSESTGVRTKKLLNEDGQCEGGGSCTWTYTSISDSSENRRTVVTTPQGDDHVSYFRQRRPHPELPEFTGWDLGLPFTTDETEGGLFLSQEIYDGSFFEGTLLRSVYVAYEHDELYYGLEMGIWGHLYTRSNWRVEAQRTLYHDDTVNGVPRFTGIDYADFDGLGHYRSRVAFGNLRGSETQPQYAEHTEYTDYNHSMGVYELAPGTNDPIPGYTPFPPHPHPWVIGNYVSMRVEEPGSAFVSQYCFDEFTGRLKRRRMQASAGGPGAHDVLVVSTRGKRSNVETRYEEHLYGGDSQTLSTASDCEAGLPPAPAYSIRHTHFYGVRAKTEPLVPDEIDPEDPLEEPLEPFGFATLDLAIDGSTGLATTSTDPAGLATDFEYDALGRLLWIKPHANGSAGGDAWTEIYYCAAATDDPNPTCDVAGEPAHVTVRRRPNGSPNGTVLAESRFVYDPFGRVARDQRKIPGHGWTTVDTGYNALGWKAFVSERGPLGTVPHKTRFKDYDPFGRPTVIEPPDFPDNPGHDITIDYRGIRRQSRGVSVATDLVGGETRFTTEEFRDQLGRLFRVREGNGANNGMNGTNYSYDAAGRLTGVEMNGGAVTQNRGFVYDGRGFLLSETHPENGTTFYSNHDPAGNAGRKTTGPSHGQFDLAFVYDDAQRLIKIRRWTDNLLLKEFTCGDGTTAGDRSNNKVETAVRYNYVLHPEHNTPHTIAVTEAYTYAGRGGRPSLRTTAFTVGENPGPRFAQSWRYDQLGQVNELNYPVCTHPGSTCSPGNDERSRLVTFEHDLGYLTAVPGWADPISYHANGMLAEIHHANDTVYGQGLDEHWMRRPASLWIVHPTNYNLSLVEGDPDPPGTPHPYAYDGAGNVKSWDDWRYRYDAVSRVLEGEVVDGESQSYTYDPFGNILTITTGLAGEPDPPPVQLGVDPATNRLSASVYDDAGNLINRGPYSYGYDSFSMMQTMDGGGAENTYIYTADDERIWTVDSSDSPPEPWRETFTLRDLDGKVLRVFTTADGLDFEDPTDDLDQLAWSHDYVYRNGQLLATARVAGAGETYHHFHLNHLGTPLLITDPDGGVEALHSYYPFGEELNPNNDSERMKFTGHERDFNKEGQADDLDYMHARYYAPLIGRFLSVDPIPGERNHPQSWNRYAYVRNNPLGYTDPFGLTLRAMSHAARNDLCAIVGPDCARYVSFADDGTVTVSATEEQLVANEALWLLSELAVSDNAYAAYVGTEIPLEGKTVTLGNGLGEFIGFNASVTPDERPGVNYTPTGGFHGVAGVFVDVESASNVSATDGRPIHRPSMLFHEIAENYFRTEKQQQYREAHPGAIERENRLRSQRPELNEFAFGAGRFRKVVDR